MKSRDFKRKARRIYEEYLLMNSDPLPVNGVPNSLILALERLHVIKHHTRD